MPIVVPGAAVNYPSPLVAVGSYFGREPQEGRYTIPAEIDWGTMGGDDHIVAFNLQTSANTQAISQICALHVDNSACGSDVQFVFTDTQETVTIPAYEPYVLVPIFTKSLQFFVISGIDNEEVESGDVTRFSMLNFVPPPVVIPASSEQNAAVENLIDAATVGSVQLVPATTSGTLEAMCIFMQFFAASGIGTYATWHIEDGTGKVIVGGRDGAVDNMQQNVAIVNMTGLAVRFQGGLKFVIDDSTVTAGSTYSANVYYRTP